MASSSAYAAVSGHPRGEAPDQPLAAGDGAAAGQRGGRCGPRVKVVSVAAVLAACAGLAALALLPQLHTTRLAPAPAPAGRSVAAAEAGIAAEEIADDRGLRRRGRNRHERRHEHLRDGKKGRKEKYQPRDIRGKSLYFVVTDYFADPPANQPYSTCQAQGWCNGTVKGITRRLDYIQGMGFEGIWITPLIKQVYGPDADGRSGYGQYGYWAKNWFEIDPNYGTEEDVKELADELHKRDMVFVYDIVLNHVGPVHSEAMLAKYFPFDKPEYLHQRGIGDMTFDQYAKGYAYGGKGYPPPVQGIGPGAMCDAGPGGDCSNYKCPVDAGFGNPCPVMQTYWGDLDPPQKAPGPKDIPMCGVGDVVCAGYNEAQTIEGWFYDLGDLNHSHPFVRKELIEWGRHMRDTYHIDGFRLDTAPYVRKDFLAEFQRAVGIPILGEVTASNWTFFKSYSPRRSRRLRQRRVLKGLLNFYLQNLATPGFCGPPAFFPGADLNLSSLAAAMTKEFAVGNGLNDVDLLGNFVDNHDMARLAIFCQGVMPRMKNAIAWAMLVRGIPIVYYGTEHFFNETHPPMWNAGYATDTPGYEFLKSLNKVRSTFGLGTAPVSVEAASANHLVFSRGIGHNKVYVFLNNDNSTKAVAYNVTGVLPEGGDGKVWVDVLHDYAEAKIEHGKFHALSTDPAVLALVSASSLQHRRKKSGVAAESAQKE